jgi:hypothetical protein
MSGHILIACEMIRNEVEKVMRDRGLSMPVVWIERGLHECPDRLHAHLQETIDSNRDKSCILLAYGLCGNAALGLNTSESVLILPRFHDCIRMFHAFKKNAEPAVSAATIYLTGGWAADYLDIIKQYGVRYSEEKKRVILDTMYGNYSNLCILDTGASDTGEVEVKARELADILRLKIEYARGTVRVLDDLLMERWDEEFCVIPPGKSITDDLFHPPT